MSGCSGGYMWLFRGYDVCVCVWLFRGYDVCVAVQGAMKR